VALFSGWTAALGDELWRTDGTREGTWLLKELTPGAAGSQISQLTVVGEYLYFVANGRQLWRTDGSAAGTAMMRDFEIAPGPRELINVGGTLYFTAQTPELSWSLWRSHGTASGTLAIWSGNVHSLVNLHDELYFGIGDQLWKKIDKDDGALLVKDANPDSSLEELYEMTVAGGAIFFAANDGTNGYELWKSDGTETGTVMIRDLRDGPESSHPQQFTAVDKIIYFTAIDDLHGSELWKTDGTAEGTQLVADLLAGPSSSYPNNLTNVSGDLFFTANDQSHDFEPWVIRGPQHADFDENGRVDGADFLAWQRSLGAAADPAGSGADGDGNGTVGSEDLGVWQNNFGAGGSASGSAAAAVGASELAMAALVADEEAVDDGEEQSGAGFGVAADAAFAWLAAERTTTDHGVWKRSPAVEVELLARDHAARSSMLPPSAKNERDGDWKPGDFARKLRTAELSFGASEAAAESQGFLAATLDKWATREAFRAAVRR
jgi:ELWxxDGT repeat protein